MPIAPATDLAASKTRLETGTLLPGQETTFRITVRNLGPFTAVGALAGDLMPDGLTPVSAPAGCDIQGQIVLCDAGDLAAGAERSFDLVARAEAAAAGTTVVEPRRRALLRHGGSLPGEQRGAARRPDRRRAARAAPPPPPPPPATPPAPVPTDVALRVIGPDGTVRAGEPSRWRIEVTNVSPVAAAGVTLDGAARGAALGTTARAAQAGCGPAPPDGCGLGTLAPGATRSVAVTLTPRRTGTLTLAGTVRVAGSETRTDNNADAATVEVAAGTTAVSVRVAAPETRVAAGERLPLRVVVRNRGARAARGATVCIRLPRGLGVARAGALQRRGARLCRRIGTLPAGARRTVRLRARVTCIPGRRVVRATVRGGNIGTRRARLTIRVACAPPPPAFTG